MGINMADTSKDGLVLGRGIHHITTTSLLTRDVVVNKFLLPYVISFRYVYFCQYFACLRERIFNCCNVLLSSWSQSSRSNS